MNDVDIRNLKDEDFTFCLPLYVEPDEKCREFLEDKSTNFSMTLTYQVIDRGADEPDRLYIYPSSFNGAPISEQDAIKSVYIKLPKFRYKKDQIACFATFANATALLADKRNIGLRTPSEKLKKMMNVRYILEISFSGLTYENKEFLANYLILLGITPGKKASKANDSK